MKNILKRRRLIVFGIVIALIVAGFYFVRGRDKNKITYQTSTVQRGTIVSSVSASGQILTTNLVNVSTQATGVIKTVYVKDGQKVYAGQKIAEITLDSDGALVNIKAWASLVSAQVALNSANNNYRSTQASLQKVYDDIKGHDLDETFVQKETRTKAEVANDNAFDAVKSAKANLASASLSYRQSSPIIVAPMSGTVDNITITPGLVLSNTSTTTSSNRVAVVRSTSNLMATFNVSEVDVNRVTPGQKVTITLDSISGKTFTGKVLTVDKIGIVSSGVTNYPVIISFDTSAPEILPNMTATANLIIDSKNNVLKIPSESVQTELDGVSTVRVLRDGQPQKVVIETGLVSDTETEVISGINEGDQIITGISSGLSNQGNFSNSPFSTFRVGGGAGGGARVGR